MRTESEIIEAMLELQDRITRVKVSNPECCEGNEYYKTLCHKMQALKFVAGINKVIA